MTHNDDILFGWDMRHKPPLTVMPTGKGWESSRGRLAYSVMNRSNERNYSEYALEVLGMVPKNYVIVNEDEVRVDRETALRVGHKRVAIPVKEFARQRMLTLDEQWELMNPRWAGTYFSLTTITKALRPELKDAMYQAMADDQYDEFMAQFWNPESDNYKAIKRLRNRASELRQRVVACDKEIYGASAKVHKIEKRKTPGNADDMAELREKINYLQSLRDELQGKAERIEKYLKRLEV